MTANRKVTARYAEIARFLGLHFNEEFCVAYGEKDGFTLRVSGLDTGRGIEYGMVCISVGVAENGVKFEPDKQFRKEHKGIIISVVIMIVMTYVGDRVDWAIMIARELETDVFYGYRLVPLLLSEEVIDMTSYVLSLVLLYAFLLVGAIPTISNAMRKDKVAGTICKL